MAACGRRATRRPGEFMTVNNNFPENETKPQYFDENRIKHLTTDRCEKQFATDKNYSCSLFFLAV